jgi:hypothetical protein
MKNQSELAWAAGFFDGEGYIGLAHQHWQGRCRRQMHAHVSQTDERPLWRFRHAVGFGRITRRPDSPKRPIHWKRQWRWDVSSFEHTQALMAMLWKFLSTPKREQARLAILAAKDWRINRETIRERCDQR